MLIEFSITNFLSFKEKNTFSKVGIILSAIGLGITAINSIAGVIIALKQL